MVQGNEGLNTEDVLKDFVWKGRKHRGWFDNESLVESQFNWFVQDIKTSLVSD